MNYKYFFLFYLVILMPISCGKIAKESTEEVVKLVAKEEGKVIAGKSISKLATTTENKLLTAAVKSESKAVVSKVVTASTENKLLTAAVKSESKVVASKVATTTTENKLLRAATKKESKVIARESTNKLAETGNKLLTATKNSSTKIQKIANATKMSYKRFFVKDKNQFITYNKFEKWLSNSDNNKKLILGKPKDGGVLRENLRMVMGRDYDKFAKANQFDAHHLVATDSRSQSSIISQKILKKYQIDINDPMNGIILPKNGQSVYFGTIHNGGHKKAYHDLVAQKLRTAKNRVQCMEILDQIKMDLYKGKIELYNVHKVNNLTSAYK